MKVSKLVVPRPSDILRCAGCAFEKAATSTSSFAYLVTLAAVADASIASSATAIISLDEAMAMVGCSTVALGCVRVRGVDRRERERYMIREVL
jgi:hypothetical protein